MIVFTYVPFLIWTISVLEHSSNAWTSSPIKLLSQKVQCRWARGILLCILECLPNSIGNLWLLVRNLHKAMLCCLVRSIKYFSSTNLILKALYKIRISFWQASACQVWTNWFCRLILTCTFSQSTVKFGDSTWKRLPSPQYWEYCGFSLPKETANCYLYIAYAVLGI